MGTRLRKSTFRNTSPEDSRPSLPPSERVSSRERFSADAPSGVKDRTWGGGRPVFLRLRYPLPALTDRFADLRRRLAEIHDVEKSAGVLSWDEETKMPPSGAEARAEQRATLNRIAHELNVSPDLGELLEALRPFEEEHDFESFEASLIRIGRRDYEKAVRVPPDLR